MGISWLFDGGDVSLVRSWKLPTNTSTIFRENNSTIVMRAAQMNRQPPMHWSDPRPKRSQQDTPRRRPRSISTERTRQPMNIYCRTPKNQRQASDPPSVGRFTLDGARPYHSDDESTLRNSRRVQFSRKLEITKTGPTSFSPILRTTNRSHPVDDTHVRATATNSRGTFQTREPNGTTLCPTPADPPTDESREPPSPSVKSLVSAINLSFVSKNRSDLPPTPSRRSPCSDHRRPFLQDERAGGPSPTPAHSYPLPQHVGASSSSEFSFYHQSVSRSLRELPPTPSRHSPYREQPRLSPQIEPHDERVEEMTPNPSHKCNFPPSVGSSETSGSSTYQYNMSRMIPELPPTPSRPSSSGDRRRPSPQRESLHEGELPPTPSCNQPKPRPIGSSGSTIRQSNVSRNVRELPPTPSGPSDSRVQRRPPSPQRGNRCESMRELPPTPSCNQPTPRPIGPAGSTSRQSRNFRELPPTPSRPSPSRVQRRPSPQREGPHERIGRRSPNPSRNHLIPMSAGSTGSSTYHPTESRNMRRLPPTPSRPSPSRIPKRPPPQRESRQGLPHTSFCTASSRRLDFGRRVKYMKPPYPQHGHPVDTVNPENSGVQGLAQTPEQDFTRFESYRESQNPFSNGSSQSKEHRSMVRRRVAIPRRYASGVNRATGEICRIPLHSSTSAHTLSSDQWSIERLFEEEPMDTAEVEPMITPISDNKSKDRSASPSCRSANEILHDLWKNDSTSPESVPIRGQSDYLTSKYARNAKDRRHEIPFLGSPVSYASDGGPKSYPNQEKKRGSKRRSSSADDEFFSQSITMLKSEEQCAPFFSGEEIRKQGILGRFFRKRRKRNIPNPNLSHVSPVNSMSDSLEIFQKRTSETDEMELAWNVDSRASQWNDFEKTSQASDESDDAYLIPDSQQAKKRIRTSMIVSILLLCVLGTGLPVYFYILADKHEKQVDIVNKSMCSAVTEEVGGVQFSADTNSTFSARFTAINELLSGSMGNTSQIGVAGSPQRKALCWLSDYDKRKLEVQQGNRQSLIQRYTMAVLFFSLSNSESEDPRSLKETDFLSSSHECSWKGTMCNDYDAVTALLLGDSFLQGQIAEEIGNLKNLSE
eukprot:scaffold346_cov116-Cylindrotheca_fusiformis.AAC.24